MPQSATAVRKPRRRWPFILLAIFIGISVLAFLVLQVAFSINAIPEEKLEPPAELLRETSAIARTHHVPSAAPTPLPKTYLELVGLSPSDTRAVAYTQLEKDFNWPPLPQGWSPGDPLSDAQREWLDRHDSIVQAAIVLTSAGGLPPFPHELAAATDFKNPFPEPHFYALQMFAKTLALEARRRADSGDVKGAADLMIGVDPVAHAIREPQLLNHLVAVGIADIPSRYVNRWVESGEIIPANIALRLHGAFGAYALRLEDARFVLEVEYRSSRG